jgi:uncharacterized protein (DUF4415 family)
MKRNTTGKPLESDLERLRALPDAAIVIDEDTPYDPNDPAAVKAFWKDAVVVKQGGVPAVREALARRGRGLGRKAKKVLLSVRYSPEVVEYFKSTGEGWQARMDEALREWMAAHRSA